MMNFISMPTITFVALDVNSRPTTSTKNNYSKKRRKKHKGRHFSTNAGDAML
jgi:hypothetical protein